MTQHQHLPPKSNMLDQVDIDEQVLTNVLTKILPTMDARTVTLSNLLETIQRRLRVEKEDLKAWKPLIKVLVGELLHLCHHGSTPSKPTEKTVKEAAPSPAATAGHTSADEASEEEFNVAPKKAVKSKRVLVDDSDDDEPSHSKTPQKKVEQADESRQKEQSDDETSDGRNKQLHMKRHKPSMSKRVVEESDDEDTGDSDDEDQPRARKHAKSTKAKSSSSRQSSEDESDSTLTKRGKRKAKGREEKTSKKRRSVPAKPTKSDVPTTPGLEALKQMAKIAGVLAPGLYRKLREADSVDEAEEILRDRLDQVNVHWSGKYPSKFDMAALKKKKDLERELDGIDPSLILDSGRSPRRSRETAPPVVTKRSIVVEDSDDGSEASFDANKFGNSDSEGNDGSDGDNEE
ncbi:hypothetical protein AeNC1_002230 [Aphanomyces euteiches]|nr:hypothetical protein AeNC1_002230 [Aphanomyces euteiches]